MSDDEMVTVSREAMTQLFGKWGLPPWPDKDGNLTLGGDVDCAPLATEIAADIAKLCGDPEPGRIRSDGPVTYFVIPLDADYNPEGRQG